MTQRACHLESNVVLETLISLAQVKKQQDWRLEDVKQFNTTDS